MCTKPAEEERKRGHRHALSGLLRAPRASSTRTQPKGKRAHERRPHRAKSYKKRGKECMHSQSKGPMHCPKEAPPGDKQLRSAGRARKLYTIAHRTSPQARSTPRRERRKGSLLKAEAQPSSFTFSIVSLINPVIRFVTVAKRLVRRSRVPTFSHSLRTGSSQAHKTCQCFVRTNL